MLKAGIIGCGRIIEEGHSVAYGELTDKVRVAALSDPSEVRRALIGEKLGVPESSRYADYRDMLAKERLDFVDVAVPHFLHESTVVDCANSKVNILLEKPMATDLAAADRMIEAVKANGVKLNVLHNYRYQGPYSVAIKLIKEGAIGRPFLIRSEGQGGGHYPGAKGYDPDWRTRSARAGGGCLLDNGYHNIYLTDEMMLSPIKYVSGVTGTFVQPIDVDDTAMVVFNHANGGMSSIQVAWSVKAGGTRVNEVHGTEGSIRFGHEGQPLALYLNSKGEWEFPPVPETHRSGFPGIFADFVASLENGTPVPVGWEKARRNLAIVMAAYESGRTHQVVEV